MTTPTQPLDIGKLLALADRATAICSDLRKGERMNEKLGTVGDYEVRSQPDFFALGCIEALETLASGLRTIASNALSPTTTEEK